MYPLIEITTVPIEIEIKTTQARLEVARGTAEMEISRGKDNNLSIRSRPIRINMDTFEPRGATPFADAHQAVLSKGAATPSYTTTASGTTAQALQGQLLLNSHIGRNPALMGKDAQLGAVQAPFSRGVYHQQIPAQEANVQQLSQKSSQPFPDEGEIRIRYEMDKMNFGFRFGAGGFEFVPGDVEISVTQQADLIIKYMGGPLYVPPSSDPDYEPVDVQA